MSLVYLDTETTGLDFMRHDIVEVAWAAGDDPIKSFVPKHTLDGADPKSLDLNGYWKRGLWAKTDSAPVPLLLMDLRGATIVGSNPAFDTAFLRRKFGVAVWHHRLFDIAAYAAGKWGMDRPPGLADIVKRLRAEGHDIADPDHTAAGDVDVLRDAHKALLNQGEL